MIVPFLMSAASVAASSVSVDRMETSPGVVSSVTAAIVSAVSPTRRNTGTLPTSAQLEAWENKVNRPHDWRDTLHVIPRVNTSPYIGSNSTEMNLGEFARLCGEVTDTGIKGGTVLAVLCSVETYAGFTDTRRSGLTTYYPGRNPSLYCHNPGNFKVPRTTARTVRDTPPWWFIVDGVASLDCYPAFTNFNEGIRSWGQLTFMNSRYNQYGTIAALREGNLRLFTQAIGRGGYAASYSANPRSMHSRAKMLCRLAPFNNRSGPPSLDARNIVID